jgi:hypothetical protein
MLVITGTSCIVAGDMPAMLFVLLRANSWKITSIAAVTTRFSLGGCIVTVAVAYRDCRCVNIRSFSPVLPVPPSYCLRRGSIMVPSYFTQPLWSAVLFASTLSWLFIMN